ncbi:MAG: hypothetical protein KDK02_14040 [Rhodobacteraceae bacterium]|nr:hypothetical protein [Paracoccaceae bacterium]
MTVRRNPPAPIYRRIPVLGLALALGLAWQPAAAGPFEDLAPCFSVQHDLDGLAAAFVADGWTVAGDGPERDRAASATAEINWALRTSIGRFRSPQQAREFLNRAHRTHDLRTDPYVLLVRDDRSLILEWSTNGSRGQNICLMAAAEIDYVGTGLPPGAVDPDRQRYFAAVSVPLLRAEAHIRQVQAALARLRVPDEARGDLVGGDGVRLSVVYKYE